MNRFTHLGMSIALLLGGLGTLQSTHAQSTTSQACDAGEVLTKTRTQQVGDRRIDTECTSVRELLVDIGCLDGEILQRGNGALQCADNNDTAPATTAGGSSSPRCRNGYLVTATSNGRAASCRYIEDVLDAATSSCADGSVLRVSNGAMHCGDYLGLGTLTALPTTASTGTNCGSGQVMQYDADGDEQCVAVGFVLAGAFPNCQAHETLVFDEYGEASCGGPPTCGAGQLAVVTSDGTQCRDVADALSGLCASGEILQKGNGVMQCASNDGVVPTGSTVPGSNAETATGSRSTTPTGDEEDDACGTHEVATRQADGLIGCTSIGQLIDTITGTCRNRHLLRFTDEDRQTAVDRQIDSDLHCNDYGNLSPTEALADAPVQSAMEACTAGQVVRFGETGLQCENLATVLEEAYECNFDETLVFDSGGAASCGRALTTCPAGQLEWSESYWFCRADVGDADIGVEHVLADEEGATEGIIGSKGSAAYECIWRRGTDGTVGHWSGPSGVVDCDEDPLLCPMGEAAKTQGYQCAAEPPGGNWKVLPQERKYCMDDLYLDLDNTRSCYALIGVPDAPEVEGATDSTVTFTWPPVDHADSYVVEQYSGVGCSGVLVKKFDPVGATLTVSGLDTGKDYYFLVRASRDGVLGDRSACATASTTVTPPPVPGNLRMGSSTTASVVLNWNASVSAHGRTPKYEVRQYGDVGCTQDEKLHGLVMETTKTITQLSPDTTYYFTVRAADFFDEHGNPDQRSESGWHACTPATTMPLTHCPAGTRPWTVGGNACRDDVPQTVVGAASVMLTDGSGRNVDAPELMGTAHVQCTTKGWGAPLETPAATCQRDVALCPTSSGTGYLCRAITPGTYWETVPASSKYCTAAQSSCFVYVPPPIGPTVNSAGDDTITVGWNSVANAARYHVNWYDNNNCSGNPSSSVATGTSQTFTGLSAGTAYSFKVATERGGVRGRHYTACTTVTTTVTPPSVPGNLRVKSRGNTSVTMQWDASTSGRPVTYTLTRYNGDSCTGTGATETTSATELQSNNLVSGNSYSFRVRASNFPDGNGGWDARGNSGWHACVSATTTVTPPTVPGNLRAESRGYTSITMAWDASASPGGRSVTYTLTRYNSNDCTGNVQATLETSGTELTVNDLAYATNYSFQVKASDFPDGSGGWDPHGDSDPHACVSAATTWIPNFVSNNVFDAEIGSVVLWRDEYAGRFDENPGTFPYRYWGLEVELDRIEISNVSGPYADSHIDSSLVVGGGYTAMDHIHFNFYNHSETLDDPERDAAVWLNIGYRSHNIDLQRKRLIDEDNRAFCIRLSNGDELGPQIYFPLAGKDDEYAFTEADLAAINPSQADAWDALEAWAISRPASPNLEIVLVALGSGFDARTLSVVEQSNSDTDSGSDAD